MARLNVIYRDGDVSIEGYIVEADVTNTVIQDKAGKTHKVDSDLVSLLNVEYNDKNLYISKWVKTIAEHYQDAEITEVEREEIQFVLKQLKKLLLGNERKSNEKYKEAIDILQSMGNLDGELDKVKGFIRDQQTEIERLKEELREVKSRPVIDIPTIYGSIRAIRSSDPNYPGVYVDVVDDENGAQSAVLVELNDGDIKVHNWKQGQEDAISSYCWVDSSRYFDTYFWKK